MQRHMLHAAAAATANGVIINTSGLMVAVQVTGTFVATLAWKVSIDGVNFVAAIGTNIATGATATTATAPGIYTIPVVPGGAFMADLTYTSGAVTATAIEYS